MSKIQKDAHLGSTSPQKHSVSQSFIFKMIENVKNTLVAFEQLSLAVMKV